MIELKEEISSGMICSYILETGIETKLPLSDPEGYIDNISVPASANKKSLHFDKDSIVIGVNRINTRYAKLLFAKIFWDIIGMDMVKKPVNEYGWELTDSVLWGGRVSEGQNCSIGGSGYGYVWDHTNKEYIVFPHLGRVIIGDRVTIHNNVTIDRGALTDTVIGDGTKIGNHSNVGHGVIIGKNCLITSGVFIGGRAQIGNNVKIGFRAQMRAIKVGDNAVIGQGSNVMENVGENEKWAGNPARYIGIYDGGEW